MSEEFSGAQGAPYPDWHRDVVLEALRACADRPRPAAEQLVGRLVEVLAGGVAAATEVPLLLVGADAACIVVERRDGVLAAIPWRHIYAVRARERACRMCGCTDERACSDGCYWVEVDLCSACEERAEHDAALAEQMEFEAEGG